MSINNKDLEQQVLSTKENREIAKGNSGYGMHIGVWITATVIALLCGGSYTAGFICWGIAALISLLISSYNKVINTQQRKQIQANRATRSDYITEILSKNKNNGFSLSREVGDADAEYAIAIDQEHKIWLLISGNRRETFSYRFSDLIEYKVCQDGKTLISGNSGDAFLGGLVFGTIGAIAGASGAKETTQNCTDLYIDITVNDVQHPHQKLSFITDAISRESIEYKYKTEFAKEIASLLAFIKANASSVEYNETPVSQPASIENVSNDKANSVNDEYMELERLFSLKEKGIISEEDFFIKKKQLLGL